MMHVTDSSGNRFLVERCVFFGHLKHPKVVDIHAKMTLLLISGIKPVAWIHVVSKPGTMQ
jgi:hypothetical protein